MSARDGLLVARGLATHFPLGSRWFGEREWIRAVDGVDLTIGRGEILGLVGESGSGKTTLGRSVLRLIEPTAGRIRFDGIDLLPLRGRELRAMRRRMQIVFQDPYTALSPRRQIRQIIAEPLRLHGLLTSPRRVDGEVARLLNRVGLEPYMMDRYPHEMSGGQRQRIAIARALSVQPDFIVADEPVSALDVSVRAQVLNILLDLRRMEGISILLISHDLGVVRRVADRIAVMYRGGIVEEGATDVVLGSPQHPYTAALLSAIPAPDPDVRQERIRLRGVPPPATERPVGCPFASRCPEAEVRCEEGLPGLEERCGRLVACHRR